MNVNNVLQKTNFSFVSVNDVQNLSIHWGKHKLQRFHVTITHFISIHWFYFFLHFFFFWCFEWYEFETFQINDES